MSTPLTCLIRDAQQGDRHAADALFAATYADLRRLAWARLRAVSRQTLLDTGALVHESYLRFAQGHNRSLDSRAHFMRWAAQVMRSVIVDHARRTFADRRGSGGQHVPIDDQQLPGSTPEVEILGVHRALARIATLYPRLSQLVEMRYFGGMTETEIAEVLGVTERTVRRGWLKARLLLRAELAD